MVNINQVALCKVLNSFYLKFPIHQRIFLQNLYILLHQPQSGQGSSNSLSMIRISNCCLYRIRFVGWKLDAYQVHG